MEPPEQVNDGTFSTMFFCNKCNKTHFVTISNSILKSRIFPVAYAYIHGTPRVIALIYIDSEGDVRGVDYPQGIGISSDELNQILIRGKEKSLEKLPRDSIIAFKLTNSQEILKIFIKEGYEDIINLSNVNEMKIFNPKIPHYQDQCVEYYLKYENFWIAGMELMEFNFFLVVEDKIDLEHLKSQMMQLFENIAD